MKLGLVLPSFIYNRERETLADAGLRSLMNSESLIGQVTLLLLVKAGTGELYTSYLNKLQEKFRVILRTDDGLSGTEQTLAYGTQYLIDSFGMDTITWMGDDALFHSFWLWKLEALIKRHPTAKSWSVYRSAFEQEHKTIDDTGEDVLVRSICGHGMTFSKKEWQEWGINWKTKDWNIPATLDLIHSKERDGERWVTKQSWLTHTGRQGVHTNIFVPEYGVDFQYDGK